MIYIFACEKRNLFEDILENLHVYFKNMLYVFGTL